MKRRTNVMIIMAAVAMVFAGCQKENKGIRLFAEGFNGDSKLVVTGRTSSWLENDQVNINGTEYDITLDGNDAYVEGVPTNANGYVAFYPTRLKENVEATNLTFPSEFYYIPFNIEGSIEQHIDAPMYAQASGENVSSLYFKHLGAALNLHINVTNPNTNKPDAVNISKIEICSNSYRLNGSIEVDYTNGNLTVDPDPFNPPDDHTSATLVTIYPPNDDTHFTIGDMTDIQIPVLPVGEGNKFTIRVYRYVSLANDESEEEEIFNETQGTGGPLARGQMAYVNVELEGTDLNGYRHEGDEED